jgi:8-oxo-dGTP pyrophosphatase MutT (NUDIX family)
VKAVQRLTPELRQQIQANLDAFERHALSLPEHRRAAVGVVVLDDEVGRACFVLTRRRGTLRRHAGQFALPGGRLDPGETVESAALREIEEEIGLCLEPSAVLGRLDDFATRSQHLITPAVVWAGQDVALAPSPDEVEAVYRVPLSDLERPGNPRISRIPESDRPLIHFGLVGTTVFAPTAAILFQFREVALHARPTRVAHFEQPLFAWQ